jgi:hypothetical protein
MYCIAYKLVVMYLGVARRFGGTKKGGSLGKGVVVHLNRRQISDCWLITLQSSAVFTCHALFYSSFFPSDLYLSHPAFLLRLARSAHLVFSAFRTSTRPASLGAATLRPAHSPPTPASPPPPYPSRPRVSFRAQCLPVLFRVPYSGFTAAQPSQRRVAT